MSNVTVNGKALSTPWVRDLNKGALAHAKEALSQHRDGYDTIGVRLANGDEKLILSRSARALQAQDVVMIDGQKAEVVFVENERNTAAEGFKGAFSSKGAKIGTGVSGAAGGGVLGVLGYLFSSIPVPRNVISSTIGGGAVGALLGAGAAALGIGGWGAVKAARTKADNGVSDRVVAYQPPKTSKSPVDDVLDRINKTLPKLEDWMRKGEDAVKEGKEQLDKAKDQIDKAKDSVKKLPL